MDLARQRATHQRLTVAFFSAGRCSDWPCSSVYQRRLHTRAQHQDSISETCRSANTHQAAHRASHRGTLQLRSVTSRVHCLYSPAVDEIRLPVASLQKRESVIPMVPTAQHISEHIMVKNHLNPQQQKKRRKKAGQMYHLRPTDLLVAAVKLRVSPQRVQQDTSSLASLRRAVAAEL